MKSLVLPLCSLILSGLFLQACGSKKSSKKPSPEPSRYFTHGNPEELIAGSSLDQTSFLKLEDLNQFQDFTLSGWFSFSQRSPRQEFSTWKEVEEENSTDRPEDNDLTPDAPSRWRFSELSDQSYILTWVGGGSNRAFLVFKLRDGALQLDSMNDVPLQMKHYSFKKDKKAFNFLFTLDDPEYGLTLNSLTFTAVPKEAQEPARIGDFSFLFSNFAIKWAEPISIEATGPLTEPEKATIRYSLAAWYGRDWAAPSRAVKLSFSEKFPPFSDLNHQGLTIVPSFRAESGDRFFVAGVTLPVVNAFESNFVDSDIFIFAANNQGPYTGEPDHTIIHELGHFFGLGHEFAKKVSGDSLYSSVMAYADASESVTDRDRKAIRALYGKDLGPLLDSE